MDPQDGREHTQPGMGRMIKVLKSGLIRPRGRLCGVARPGGPMPSSPPPAELAHVLVGAPAAQIVA